MDPDNAMFISIYEQMDENDRRKRKLIHAIILADLADSVGMNDMKTKMDGFAQEYAQNGWNLLTNNDHLLWTTLPTLRLDQKVELYERINRAIQSGEPRHVDEFKQRIVSHSFGGSGLQPLLIHAFKKMINARNTRDELGLIVHAFVNGVKLKLPVRTPQQRKSKKSVAFIKPTFLFP